MQLDGLDGLRGLAVLFVVASHLGTSGLPLGIGVDFSGSGKYGVYLFFVLSAFLLTRQILRSDPRRVRRGDHWTAYAVRRLLRVFPLYLVVLTVDLIGTRVGSELVTTLTGAEFVQHLTLTAGKSLYWTIPVEIKYYVVLPFVGLALVARPWRHPVAVAGIGIAVIVCSSSWLWPGDAYALRSLELGPYLPIFFAGSLTAYVHDSLEGRTLPPTRVARLALDAVAATALIAVFCMIPDVWRRLSGGPVELQRFHRDYWLFGLLWSLVLLATVHGTGVLRALFSSTWLRWLGTVSFSVYLWHLFVLRLVTQEWPVTPLLQTWTVLALAFGVSAISYLSIERPFLRLGARIDLGHATRTRPANGDTR